MSILQFAAPAAALLAAALLVWGMYAYFTASGTEMRQRVRQYGKGQRTAAKTKVRASNLFKDRSLSGFGILDRLLSGKAYADNIALDLARAAVPLRVGEYLLIRWVVAAGLLIVAAMAGLPLPAAIIVGALGFFIPKTWVGRREKGRIKKIEDQLVDALTMMANALRSGNSFLQAMELVSRELPAPISEEFGQVVAEAGVGAQLDQSLADLAERVRSYDVYLMVTAMTIQRSVGGNLSEVLDKIAHTIRERQRLLRQVQVETAEQRFSAYILLALPTFMLVVIMTINRPYVEPLIALTSGRLLLVLAVVLQVFGYLVMRKIADIKV